QTSVVLPDGTPKGFDFNYLPPGGRLDIRLVERRCLGYLDKSGSRFDCPDNAPADGEISGYCDGCAHRTYVPFAQRHGYRTRPNLNPKLTPHLVYLAVFGPHTFKVGTSGARRIR